MTLCMTHNFMYLILHATTYAHACASAHAIVCTHICKIMFEQLPVCGMTWHDAYVFVEKSVQDLRHIIFVQDVSRRNAQGFISEK